MPVLVVQEQYTKAVMAGILDGDYGLTKAGEAAEALMLDLSEFGTSKTLIRFRSTIGAYLPGLAAARRDALKRQGVWKT